MFTRFTKTLRTFLPLTLAFFINKQQPLWMSSQTQRVLSPKIKMVSEIGQYIDAQNDKSKAVLICQLHGDKLIDEQLICLAQQFIRYAQGNISVDYDFVFVPSNLFAGEEVENYLIIYSNRGQKIINLEPYLNKNKNKPSLHINRKPLMKRLLQAINGHREISVNNIAEQLNSIKHTTNYSALVCIPSPNKQPTQQLDNYLKNHSIKSKTCSKYIIKDNLSKNILGFNNKPPGIYILTPINNNLLPQVKQQIKQSFKIGQKKYTILNITHQLHHIFSIPPIQEQIEHTQIVLNVYINKNHNTANIQRNIVIELAKPQYRHLHKALYYTNQVSDATLTLEMNDYSKLALSAFDPHKPIPPQQVKEILGNTYQWNYPLQADQPINSASLQQWIQQCTQGPHKMDLQHFKSQKVEQAWSTMLTGSQYKDKLLEPKDKIIYHYSAHCHGCKKFGGKYEQFARDSHLFPGVTFYRINNDRNKAENVRNYNSTPVFAYYKQNCLIPFVYRMPIFTQQLFQSFIRITGDLSLMDNQVLQHAVTKQQQAQPFIIDLLTNRMI